MKNVIHKMVSALLTLIMILSFMAICQTAIAQSSPPPVDDDSFIVAPSSPLLSPKEFQALQFFTFGDEEEGQGQFVVNRYVQCTDSCTNPFPHFIRIEAGFLISDTIRYRCNDFFWIESEPSCEPAGIIENRFDN